MSSDQITITLPNGDTLDVERGATAGDVAAAIAHDRRSNPLRKKRFAFANGFMLPSSRAGARPCSAR